MFSQLEANSVLYKTILEKDSLLFNIGFNTCDITQFEVLVSEDFEFYHDKGGVVKSKSEFIESFKNGICGLEYTAIRKLEASKTEIFPLYDHGELYSIIQNGVHYFYAKEGDSPMHLTSIARFTHLWKLENGSWKLSRTLSFDHDAVENPITN